jgi:hypothetical protein
MRLGELLHVSVSDSFVTLEYRNWQREASQHSTVGMRGLWEDVTRESSAQTRTARIGSNSVMVAPIGVEPQSGRMGELERRGK